MEERLTVKVPGKLMVAGEFAVLEPHERLFVMAVNKYVFTSIEGSRDHLLSLENFELYNLPWRFDGRRVHVSTDDARISYVQRAMEVTFRYLVEQGYSIKPFTLSVRSELDDGAGKKYGLGSSAAVVTSVVAAVLKHVAGEADKEKVFKLASITHVMIQGNGSGADIAASTYGGLLLYTSFQAEWLLELIEEHETMTEMLEADWVYFSVKETVFPSHIYPYVGWTGSPASTGDLVSNIRKLKIESPEKYKQFIEHSRQAVNQLMVGIERDDEGIFMEGIHQNRLALTQLGKDAHVAIDTPDLDRLSDIAIALGGVGKFSGAGGGDCGFAFMQDAGKGSLLFKKWEEYGIKPLPLDVEYEGISFISE